MTSPPAAHPVGRSVLAARIREARTAIGLSQNDVATIGIGRTAVTDLEAGRRKVTGLELRRMARLFRRPVEWLLGDDGPAAGDEVIAAVRACPPATGRRCCDSARFLAHQATAHDEEIR